jgi:predicted nucleotidyltransferase component of viral defense system
MAWERHRGLDWLRLQLVGALAADEELFELLVFKGGNALALVHRIGMRASLDLDYSLSREAESDEELGARIRRALEAHLARHGLTVFDWSFTSRPEGPRRERAPFWGGYVGEFKVIETATWARLGESLGQARRQAWGITSGGGAPRRFRVELSRREHCASAMQTVIGAGVVVRVYTPAMIAVEKLRALCQQSAQYALTTKRVARGRDLYDIHAVVTEADVDLGSGANRELIRAVFAAKSVPLGLLAFIEEDLALHEGEWDDVRLSLPAGRPGDFHFYADFVLRIVRRLEPLWNEQAP